MNKISIMHKIIINGRFLLHRITGVERYAHEICAELDKIVDYGSILMAVPPELTEKPMYKNIIVVKVGSLHNRAWEHISFPIYVKQMNGISLNLCNVAPLSDPGIVAIFDAKIKAHPEYYSKKFLVWYNLLLNNETRRAKKIITDSFFAKNELMHYYPWLNNDRVVVIYPSWQHYARIGYDENALKKYDLVKKSYFFSMCSLEPNKNFKWIAEEAKRLPDQIFAIAGSINKTVFADGLGFECPKNMKLLGYVSDEEAKSLMRDCKAFLFPTFYEGFGIPPLEAISAGCKCVVVSDTPVMHEIFENKANYIDLSLKNVMQLNNELCEYDYTSILNKFSWMMSAQKLLEILKQVEER